jgi:plasmid stability protein
MNMQSACYGALCMGNIQVRNVPDDVHRALKARAARLGLSLSEYLNEELRRLAVLPTFDELSERIRRVGPVELDEEPADVIRVLREAR